MRNPLARLAPLAAAALATLAACGGTSQSLEQRSREAMPSKDSVAVATPKSSASALRADRGNTSSSFTQDQQDSTVGQVSGSYLLTVTLAGSINGAVIWTLGLIETISDLPPTSCTSDTCTWGPGSGALDPADWKLEVKHDATADTFAYALSGRAKAGGDGQFHSVVTGVAKPTVIPHRGSGSFVVDFDAGKVINPLSTDLGKLEVDYSNAVAGQGHIDAQFLGVRDGDHPGDATHPPQQLNAAYGFDEDAAGGGSLQIAFRNLTTLDTVAIHSRWKSSGAGRGDEAVHINGASGSFYEAQLSECWSKPPFLVTYFHTSDAAHLGADSGSAADCAFTDVSAATKTAP